MEPYFFSHINKHVNECQKNCFCQEMSLFFCFSSLTVILPGRFIPVTTTLKWKKKCDSLYNDLKEFWNIPRSLMYWLLRHKTPLIRINFIKVHSMFKRTWAGAKRDPPRVHATGLPLAISASWYWGFWSSSPACRPACARSWRPLLWPNAARLCQSPIGPLRAGSSCTLCNFHVQRRASFVEHL